MTAYRCYLLDDDEKIKKSEIIECLTDAAALEEAVRKFVSDGYPIIEIWEKERRIGKVRHSQDPLGTDAQKHEEASIEAPKPNTDS